MAGVVHAMSLVWAAYAAGGTLALWATRRGVPTWWGTAMRAQGVLAAGTLSLLAGWRFDTRADLVPSATIAIAVAAVFVVGAATSKEGAATGVLEGWAASSNTAFWAVPVAAMVAGPQGVAVAVIADRLLLANSWWVTGRLRAGASLPQRASTSVVDRCDMLAFATGLLLSQVAAAPSWSGTAMTWLGPAMAFVGACAWGGSVRHSLAGQPVRDPAAARRYLALTVVRVVSLVVPLVLWWGSPAAAVAALCIGTVPTLGPPRANLLYGYENPVVAVAARWGWFAAPAGLALAVLAR